MNRIVSSEGIPPPDDAERFVFCDCEECGFALACDCQEPSELVDQDGERTFAYTENVSGLLFNCR